MAANASPLLPKGKRTDLHHHPLSSVQKTFGNIVISVVGAGVLGLPYTYKRTGWLSGTIALTVIAASCYYCMLLLVRSRKRIERDERNDDVENFSDLGYFTFGEYGRHLVDAMVVLSQGAFCVAYLIFIGENLASVFAASSDGYVPDSSILGTFIRGIDWNTKVVYIWIVFPLQVALASFRSLTRLAPFSIFADVASVVAMLVVIKEDVKQIMIGAAQLQAFKGLDTVPFAIGVAIYSYEGFSLVLPLESAMEDKKKFSKVLGAALACITAGYIVFGLLGYLAFGEQTADIITLNLARGLGGVIVKILLCIALFFTFPVMMYPVYEVVERRTTGGRPSLIVRACIVVLAVWLAVSVPRFGAFLSLVGSSVCCILSFVLPCIFHLHVFGKELTWAETGIDYVFIIFGACCGLFGTISSVYDMMAH